LALLKMLLIGIYTEGAAPADTFPWAIAFAAANNQATLA